MESAREEEEEEDDEDDEDEEEELEGEVDEEVSVCVFDVESEVEGYALEAMRMGCEPESS